MYWETSGAFTGEISGAMLVDVGCTHVILGHSERRHGHGRDRRPGQRASSRPPSAAKLIPIVCIGETQDERQAEKTEAVVARPARRLARRTSAPRQMAGVVLAYEPVWAIGTGLTATPEQAQAVHAFIRSRLAENFGEATAARVVVQYGGSVKPDNAVELLACPDIDGALVGGASLKAADFLGDHRGRPGSRRPGQVVNQRREPTPRRRDRSANANLDLGPQTKGLPPWLY